MEETILKTRNKWLEQNRVVLTKAKPKQTKQIAVGDFNGLVPFFSIDDTRPARNREEEVAIWFFQRLNSYKKDWYFQPKTARKGFKKAVKYGSERCFPLSFAAVSAHFRGSGQTIGLTFKEVSHWFRIDLDNHGNLDNAKIIREFCLLYQFLIDQEPELKKRQIRWFVEFRLDLTGVHFDFWCEHQKSIRSGRQFFNEILKMVDIEAEIFPANYCCKLFGCTQYHQILDKIYRLPNLESFYDFLTDPEVYDHAPLRWITDALNFDWHELNEVGTASEKKKTLEQAHCFEVNGIGFKGRTWQNIVDFFAGTKIFDLNTICCVISRIASFQNKSADEIISALMKNLDEIPESSRKSSYFSLTKKEKEKRIRELVNNAIKLNYLDNKDLSEKKLRKTARKFTETGRDVLNPCSGMPNGGYTYPTISIVGANLDLTSLPESYTAQINTELSSILLKSQKENALQIAFSIAELCFCQSLEQKPIAKSYFMEFFQRQFAWKPRKGSELYRILDCLIDLGLIKRTEIKRTTMFWSLGDRVSEYLGIEVHGKKYSKPIRIEPEQLTEIVGYID